MGNRENVVRWVKAGVCGSLWWPASDREWWLVVSESVGSAGEYR
jgi:hypothetical protein